jgi:glucose-1-phosphatase
MVDARQPFPRSSLPFGTAMSDFDWVIFDIGGVLLHVGAVRPMAELAGIDTDDELWSRWLSCRWVRKFERGRCSVDEFASGVVSDWSLQISPNQFIEAFRSWRGQPFPGARELVAATRAEVRVACLSNMNAVQWELYREHNIGELFDQTFLSHELGLVKPDREVFDHVISALECAPGRLLFLDDNAINVEAARAAGITSERVQGVDEAARSLVEFGVLRAS